jgi:ATP-dependent Clp protease ATP-binding subunit ClpB
MIQEMHGQDYRSVKEAVMDEVKRYFRPEFINRIDEVVVFHALDQRHIKSIAQIQLQYLEKRLVALDMNLRVSDAALAALSQVGFDPVFGARPLKRAIQAQIENPLAKEILEGHFAAKDTILVDYDNDQIRFSKTG